MQVDFTTFITLQSLRDTAQAHNSHYDNIQSSTLSLWTLLIRFKSIITLGIKQVHYLMLYAMVLNNTREFHIL